EKPKPDYPNQRSTEENRPERVTPSDILTPTLFERVHVRRIGVQQRFIESLPASYSTNQRSKAMFLPPAQEEAHRVRSLCVSDGCRVRISWKAASDLLKWDQVSRQRRRP